jgi:hypothetical protein
MDIGHTTVGGGPDCHGHYLLGLPVSGESGLRENGLGPRREANRGGWAGVLRKFLTASRLGVGTREQVSET